MVDRTPHQLISEAYSYEPENVGRRRPPVNIRCDIVCESVRQKWAKGVDLSPEDIVEAMRVSVGTTYAHVDLGVGAVAAFVLDRCISVHLPQQQKEGRSSSAIIYNSDQNFEVPRDLMGKVLNWRRHSSDRGTYRWALRFFCCNVHYFIVVPTNGCWSPPPSDHCQYCSNKYLKECSSVCKPVGKRKSTSK